MVHGLSAQKLLLLHHIQFFDARLAELDSTHLQLRFKWQACLACRCWGSSLQAKGPWSGT